MLRRAPMPSPDTTLSSPIRPSRKLSDNASWMNNSTAPGCTWVSPLPITAASRRPPGLVVVLADFRFVRAFPVLNDGSDLDRLYHQNAERILLQSVAASTMSAHLAASALGYAVWWITAIGQEDIQRRMKPLLGVPEELSILDVMCFGPPARPSYK